MFIVSPTTLFNPSALETRQLPKRMIGRISIIPRRGASAALILRLILEVQVLRYLSALAPVVIAMLIWPHLALPISQAPIPMLILIYFVETRVLDMSKDKRAALVSDDEADRVLDALEFNGRRVLTRIAARLGLTHGRVVLAVEQSELARVPVLTLVSVQIDLPHPQVIELEVAEREILKTGLFDDLLTEEALHAVTLKSRQPIRTVHIEASDISAHARIAALHRSEPARNSAREVAS
jgi:hypothetical protein